MAILGSANISQKSNNYVTGGSGNASNGIFTPEQIAQLQPFFDFDLSKVKNTTGYLGQTSYGIPMQVNTGRGFATQYQDVTPYITNASKIIASAKKSPEFFGTTGKISETGNYATSEAQAFREIYGDKPQVDANGKLIPITTDPTLGRKIQYVANTPSSVVGGTGNYNTYSDILARQFQLEHPGYFQIGEDPDNKGNFNKAALDTNNIAGATDELVYQQVKYDPKYGYIAPLSASKREKPDFLNKYGRYIPLAFFGAGVAAAGIGAGAAGSAATGTGTATASGVGASGSTTLGAASAGTGLGGAGAATGAGTFNGIGLGSGLGSGGLVGGTATTGLSTGSGTLFGISGAGSTSAALGTTAAGGIGASALGSGSGISTGGTAASSLGIPSTGYPGAGITATGGLTQAPTYTTGASTLGNSAGGSQALGGLTTEQLLSGAQQAAGAIGAVSGGGAGAGGGGGSGAAAVSPHNVNWTPWSSPLTTSRAQPQAQGAFGQYGDYDPTGGAPAQNYEELKRQREQYNLAMNGYLARSRAQMGF